MHYVKTKTILSSKNWMNLYRGCSHGCIYCDSRSKCYHMEHRFEDIEVKENSIELLDDALKRKRRKCMISLGSMTDPYIPLEINLNYTRKALELIDKYGFGVTLITKSSNILRDLDLLKSINNKTKCVVQMTLTTADEELCKKIEPNVSTTKERFETIKKLRAAGIPVVVWLCPILPYINDTEKNIKRILYMCIEAKVYGIICFGMWLSLREGSREYFYHNLDKLFPGLKNIYIQEFGNNYNIYSPNHKRLMKIFHKVCNKNNIVADVNELFSYLAEFEEKNSQEQLSLF